MEGILPAWTETKSLADLCEYTVQWLSGKREEHVVHPSPPCEETGEILDYLKHLNSHGFFTINSQPGQELIDGNAQRACVSGHCVEKVAKKIASLSLSSDLIVFAYPPDCYGGYMMPVTIEGYHPFTWDGAYDENHLKCYTGEIGETALQELCRSWYLVIIDPVWGRKKCLWSKLMEVLEQETSVYSIAPSPSLGLDTDYVW